MKTTLIAAAVAAGLGASPAAALVLSSGDFSGWDVRVAGANFGTSTVTTVTTGGNPDAYVQVTNNTPNAASVVWAGMLAPQLWVVADGTLDFSYSIDVDPNVNVSGDQHAYGLFLEQDGALYVTSFGVTGPTAGWRPVTASGVLEGSNFGAAPGQTGTGPDLAQAFRIGFAAGNSRSFERGVGYDNFSLSGLEAAPASAVPVPPAAALLAAGLLALGMRRR